jgi:hypothetical protein
MHWWFMDRQDIQCPSCGATHEINNPGIITVVCEYCGNAVYWDEKKIKDAGKQSVLPEGFTRLYRGATGRLQNRSFTVMGRIRYSFGSGFWDEWFLEFADGTIGWLTEDNHELALQTRTAPKQIPPFESLHPRKKINVKKRVFVVQEEGQAECIGDERNLPIEAQTGEVYKFADASSQDGQFTLGIEYDQQPPTVFIGRWLTYTDMVLDDEGLEW